MATPRSTLLRLVGMLLLALAVVLGPAVSAVQAGGMTAASMAMSDAMDDAHMCDDCGEEAALAASCPPAACHAELALPIQGYLLGPVVAVTFTVLGDPDLLGLTARPTPQPPKLSLLA